jgi:hypothetical protein
METTAADMVRLVRVCLWDQSDMSDRRTSEDRDKGGVVIHVPSMVIWRNGYVQTDSVA